MKFHVLERSQRVPGAIDAVFDFYKRPENLQLLTPPWLNLTVRQASDPEIRVGTRIDYHFRWLGLRLRWRTTITDYVENQSFVDEMTRGPYRYWRHTHLFRPVQDGVEIDDRVEYALRFWPLGEVLHRLLVRPQLERIFDYRERQVERLMGPAPGNPARAS